MRFKILGLIAAAAFVAACETAPEEKAATSGAGAAMAATTTTPKASPPPMPMPSGPAPGSKEDFLDKVGDRIFFDFDKYNLKADARGTLEKQAAWLKKWPAATITVEGHCDERGTREYNLALGERRANSVKDYLVALGGQPEPHQDHLVWQGASRGARLQRFGLGPEPPRRDGHNRRRRSLSPASPIECFPAPPVPVPAGMGRRPIFA